jgi:hypothetical protein
MDAVHLFRAMPTTYSGGMASIFREHRNQWSPWFGISGRHAPESFGVYLIE